jgi:hypothetical protein
MQPIEAKGPTMVGRAGFEPATYGLKGPVRLLAGQAHRSPGFQERRTRNTLAEGVARTVFRRLAGVAAAAVLALPAVGLAQPGASWRPEEVSPGVEQFALIMAAFEVEAAKASGDLIFANGGESAAPPNPCAQLQEPTVLCPCPPTPPWVLACF